MIWLIGGTSPSRDVALMLQKTKRAARCGCVATTATREGRRLYESCPDVQVSVGRMRYPAIRFFMWRNRISVVIDASHPYASAVSESAMKAARKCRVPYIRYERPAIDLPGVRRFSSVKRIREYLVQQCGTVLVATGSSTLAQWRSFDTSRLIVRVLPVVSALRACIRAGVSYTQIIAAAGPFSYERNRSIFNDYDIRFLVTKESGDAGGFREKVQPALDAGITVCMLARPNLSYPCCVTNTDELEKTIERYRI